MPSRRRAEIDAAERLLSLAQAQVVDARASFEATVRELQAGVHDPGRAREIGRTLDDIARRKLFRLMGHPTFDAFVREAVGISRPTAHRMRTLARAPESLAIPTRGKTAAYEAARELVREERRAARSKSRRRRV